MKFVLHIIIGSLALCPLRLPAALTDGLVAHYKFDETTGTTAVDAVRGAAGNGTLFNFPTTNTQWITGRIGGAVTCDGVNDWITTPASIASGATAMSFSGWVWATSRPSWASIAKNWGNTITGQFHFGLNASDGRLSNYLNNSTSIIDSTVFPTGSWQQVAFTYDGATHRLYRNGAQVGALSTTTTMLQSSATVALGAKPNDAGTTAGSPAGYWNGRYDDFGFWNRALTAAEVLEIYNTGLTGQGIAGPPAPTPPLITLQPCSQNQTIGANATLSIVATGLPIPTLQWRKNTVPIPDKTLATLTLTSLTAGDAGDYDVVVTNSQGSITSNNAKLSLAPIVTSSSITADLKGYWRFDETTGCTAADTSGQNQTGNLTNFPRTSNSYWAVGKVGGALRFGAAAQQYVVVPAVPLPPASTFSLASWVMADSRPTWASIAKNWFGFTHFGLDSGGGQLSNYFGLAGGSSFVRVAETEVFPLGVWQHVVCTVDATSMKLYRNGVLVATQAMSGTPFTPLPAPLAIGAKLTGTTPDSYWDGLIDELAFWHRSLTATEVSTLYASGVQGLSLDNPNPIPPANSLVISEFLADNVSGALDEDYDSADWIELYNGSASAVNLDGYYLTDDLLSKTKWRFPAITLAVGAYQIVWASGKDRRVVGQPLHTSFQLGGDEDLALIAPDGVTVVHSYSSPLSLPSGDRYPSETNVSFGIQGGPAQVAYFTSPSPGGSNGSPLAPYGPIISNHTFTPAQPAPGQAITVAARIRPEIDEATTVLHPVNQIASTTLTYRVMFASTASVPMLDDGLNGDVLANDGIFTGTIPASHGATAGQMIRWYLTAMTTDNTQRRSPQNLLPSSPEYYGTVVTNTALTTPLPILQRFLEFPTLADTVGGTSCSIYFNGEFHDRCQIRIRGNTSRSWPKKSHKIDLPPGEKIPLHAAVVGQPDPPQVSELNLNTTYTDKSYVRALLTGELHDLSGAPTPETFHIHQRENGVFYSVAICVENVDDTFLQKHGIDDHGAFYKAVGDAGACNFTTAAAFEKKNRHPEGLTDLQSVVTNLGLTGTALETWLFDNVDLPSWVNWHAGSVISQNIDASDKNYYIYRDTLGSREWSVLPWDLDLTFGPNSLNTDTMVFNQSTPSTPACPSHPLIGARPWQLANPKFNRMIEALANTPRSRQMLARRIRSLNDQFFTTNWFGTRMDALETLLTTDVNLDHTKWGTNSHFAWSGGTAYTLAQSISRIKTLYLAGRSTYLTDASGSNHGAPYSLNFTTGLGSIGVPATQPVTPVINFGAVEANPPGGNQDQEYVELQNPGTFDVDLSGWTLKGGVTFTFQGGTVLPAGQSLYISPDRYAFRQRALSPKGGERRFVVGPYSGHLNNFGETLTLRNVAGTIINALTVPAAPSDPQRYLAISEVHYNPPGTADDTEYLEFINTSNLITLDLANVKITSGLTGTTPAGLPDYFTFSAGTQLTPGARVLVVRNLAAFQVAWPSVLPTQIAGSFPADTALDNGGEALKVEDATGSSIVDFTYDDKPPWPQLPDGNGYSLVHMNPQPGDLHHANAANWRTSALLGGSPGTSDALAPPANLTADDDANGLPNLLEHVMGDNAPFAFTFDNLGALSLTWSQRPGGDAGRIILESSANLTNWIPLTDLTAQTETMQGGLINYSAKLSADPSQRKFLRARVQAEP